MYPPAHSLPAFIPLAADAPNLHRTGAVIGIESATVAQLKTAIALQQDEVRMAADGLPQLCNLLNRRLMEGAADTDLAHVLFNNPVTHADFSRMAAEQQAEFERVMATFDFNAAIDQALKRAQRAYDDAAEKPDAEGAGVWLEVALDKKSRPLIEALAMRGIGQVEIMEFGYHIEFPQLFRKRKKSATHSVARQAAVEAFALEMSKPGFEFRVLRYEH